jgi:transposase
VRVLIATQPVDFRKGMDGLAALVKEQLRADPYAGAIFVFRARRADRVKLIVWDGTGLCLYAKRLEQGRFRWPPVADGTMRLTRRTSSKVARLAMRLVGWSSKRARTVGEPGARVYVVELRGLDQGVDGGSALAASIGAGEGSVLAANRDATHGAPAALLERQMRPSSQESA